MLVDERRPAASGRSWLQDVWDDIHIVPNSAAEGANSLRVKASSMSLSKGRSLLVLSFLTRRELPDSC